FLAFVGASRADHHTQEHVHESPAVMTIPLIILAVLAVVGGYFPVTHVVELVTGEVHVEHAPLETYGVAITLAVGGLALAWFLYGPEPHLPPPLPTAPRRLLAPARAQH